MTMDLFHFEILGATTASVIGHIDILLQFDPSPAEGRHKLSLVEDLEVACSHLVFYEEVDFIFEFPTLDFNVFNGSAEEWLTWLDRRRVS